MAAPPRDDNAIRGGGYHLAAVGLGWGGGQWLFWHDLEPVQAMATLGTITWGMAAVLAEGGIKLVFWVIEERRRKLTEREIDTLISARERLKQENDEAGAAVLDGMIDDRRR